MDFMEFYRKGFQHFFEGEYEQAISAFQTALKFITSKEELLKLDILYHLSFAYYLSGAHEHAIHICIDTINQNHIRALLLWIQLAVAYHKETDFQKAYHKVFQEKRDPSQDSIEKMFKLADSFRGIIEDGTYQPFIKKIFPNLNESAQQYVILILLSSCTTMNIKDPLFSMLGLDQKMVMKHFITLIETKLIDKLKN